MTAARKSSLWDETALVVATIMNSNMAKGKPISSDDIHPFRESDSGSRGGDVSVKLTRDNIKMLKHFAQNQGRAGG